MRQGDSVRVNHPTQPWGGVLVSAGAHEGDIWSVLRDHDNTVVPVEERHMSVLTATTG